MNKKELVRNVASKMREKNIRKTMSAQKKILHISDDEGNTSDFVIKKSEKGALFTCDDIEAIIDSCIDVIEDALKSGDIISVRGFGTLALHFRKARSTKHPDTKEDIEISERYVPKFTSGKDLKICAKIFESSLNDGSYDYHMSALYDEDEDGDGYGD